MCFRGKRWILCLRSKWEGMKGRLLEGDVDGAMEFFNESKREAYRRLLKALSAHLPAIVSEMSDIQLIEYRDRAVIYDLRTIEKAKHIPSHFFLKRTSTGFGRSLLFRGRK